MDGMNDCDLRAFLGTLQLGLSYAIGNALNQTDILTETSKNAVPLLAKMANIGDITTKASTTWLRSPNHFPDAAFIREIAIYFHDCVPQTKIDYWTRQYKAQINENRNPIYGNGQNLVDDTIQMLTQLLTGGGGIEMISSGNPLPTPDTPAGQITPFIRGQMGFPLEFRWIQERPNGPGQLWTVFQQVLNHVRTANSIEGA
jgi:hypothetical protein